MSNPENENFIRIWPKCFITLTAIIELIAVIFLFLTELGNVAANFWYGNVFAGGWCGLLMFVHVIFLLAAGCCSPSRSSAYRSMIVSVLCCVGATVLIGFDAVFLINPSVCILTPSCVSNAASNSTFATSLQSSFLVTFNKMDLFKNYSAAQSKTLFQAMQVGLGAVCLVMCIVYIVIFYIHDKRAKEQVQPFVSLMPPPPSAVQQQQNLYPPMDPVGQYGPSPYSQPMVPLNMGYGRPAWPPMPMRMAQPAPGQVPWNGSRLY